MFSLMIKSIVSSPTLDRVRCDQRHIGLVVPLHLVSCTLVILTPVLIIITDGTLRWQAPELMSGSLTQLTVEMDVYAFAICCTEVLSLGRMPWPFSSDDQVHNQVMSE